MKEKDNIDQWLRKSMADFKPELSASARERFLSAAPVKSSRSLNKGLYGALAIIVLLSVTAIVWWMNENNTQALKTSSEPAKVTDSRRENTSGAVSETKRGNILASNKPETIISSPKRSGEHNIDKKETYTSAGNRVAISKNQKVKNGNLIADGEGQNPLNVNDEGVKDDNLIADNKGNEELTRVDIPTINSEQGSNENVNSSGAAEELSKVSPSESGITSINPKEPDAKKDKKEGHADGFMNQSLCLYYRPEIIWNVIGNEKLIHNFGAEWQTRLFSGNYLLGTGIGLSLTRGYYEYAVDYNEFLGNYQQLDSITFDWNPREFTMQQTVHTSEETVFDTAVKTDYARVYRDFVYLQVPFTMGYDLINKPKYSIGVRFVPILSVLLSKKPVDFRYEAGKDRIVQINRITPDRVRTNWQINAGINYSRRLSETFWMELEPRFTYYYNSVYEKSDNSSSPMGASIRVAVGIKY